MYGSMCLYIHKHIQTHIFNPVSSKRLLNIYVKLVCNLQIPIKTKYVKNLIIVYIN